MKKMLFCAAAAIVALASCSKTHVDYNGDPQEIAFKQITGAMTKTDPALTDYHSSMGVFANENVTDSPEYFDNTEFSKSTADGATYWVANPTKYWPFQTELKFIVYAPFYETVQSPLGPQATVNYTSDPTLSISDFTVVDYDNTNVYAQKNGSTPENLNVDDLMYGSKVTVQGNTTDAVPVLLKHALSRIEVNVMATVANAITINSIVLEDVTKNSDLTVTYSEDDQSQEFPKPLVGTPAWSYNGQNANTLDLTIGTSEEVISTANSSSSYGNPFLIIPSDEQTSFTINYTLNGKSSVATVDLANSWLPGYKYVYDFTFTLNEIKLTPTVTEWEEGTVSEVTPDNDSNIDVH